MLLLPMTTLTLQTGAQKSDRLRLSNMLPSERDAIQTAETLLNRINDYRKKAGIEAMMTRIVGTTVGLFFGAAGSTLTIGHSNQADYEPTRLLEELAITALTGLAGYTIGWAAQRFGYKKEIYGIEMELTMLKKSPEYHRAMSRMSK